MGAAVVRRERDDVSMPGRTFDEIGQVFDRVGVLRVAPAAGTGTFAGPRAGVSAAIASASRGGYEEFLPGGARSARRTDRTLSRRVARAGADGVHLSARHRCRRSLGQVEPGIEG